LASSDIFVNIAGGMRIEEPAADLAVALAIASAERGVPLPGTASFGEISLTGELRSSSQPDRRCGEATRVGLGTVLMPRPDARRVGGRVPEVVGLADVKAAVGLVKGSAAPRSDDSRSADAREG
jgi:DNA repair protein RadA/Sms